MTYLARPLIPTKIQYTTSKHKEKLATTINLANLKTLTILTGTAAQYSMDDQR